MPRVDKRPIAERFWERVEKTDTCWLWKGYKLPKGYGMFCMGPKYAGHSQLAHRWAYELTHGEKPTDKQLVLHSCDNPSCVNPDHLRLGTHADNLRDASSRGRHYNTKKTHCKNGHEYTPENTFISQRKKRNTTCRICKICFNDSLLRTYARILVAHDRNST